MDYRFKYDEVFIMYDVHCHTLSVHSQWYSLYLFINAIAYTLWKLISRFWACCGFSTLYTWDSYSAKWIRTSLSGIWALINDVHMLLFEHFTRNDVRKQVNREEKPRWKKAKEKHSKWKQLFKPISHSFHSNWTCWHSAFVTIGE